ncbi:MAG: hypothetical protein KFB95_05335 [Simkaniaceae bacterium]|nr:MAG: hypothetical protein KFB95_05335 [Simkaniaceae bacterium]
MLLDEKIFASKELSKRIEFQTVQSSERRDEEIRYTNVNRKMIVFDLSDVHMMLELGIMLKPYGLNENFENKMLKSNVAAFRIWAEKKIANRAENFLRILYLKHPEKFGKVEYENSKKKRMRLAKANYILSEMTSQKSISLKDDRDEVAQLNEFKDRFTGEAQRLALQENVIKDLTHEDRQNNQTLLGMDQKEEA